MQFEPGHARRSDTPTGLTLRTPVRAMLFALLAIGALGGCPSSGTEDGAQGTEGPQSLAGTEGAVCGMVVAEQPAPRAQVLHRDGTRLHLCGIADLLMHLEARSPHGVPVEIHVEAMEPDEDPREIHLGEHEWIRAEDAVYRIGNDRPRLIMGAPVMVYRDRATAEAAISHRPTETLDFDQLKSWWRRQNI